MSKMDGTGTQRAVEEGHVAQDETKNGLKGKTKVEHAVAHALAGQRECTGLAGGKVGPLDNDDRDEECTLGMSQSLFGVMTGPIRVIRVADLAVQELKSSVLSIDTLAIGIAVKLTAIADILSEKIIGKLDKFTGVEAIVEENHKICKEPGQSLHNSNL